MSRILDVAKRTLSSRSFWLLIGLLLFGLVLTQVSWFDLWGIVSRLRVWQITLLICANAAILWTFYMRWWVLVRIVGKELGRQVPFRSIARYGLIGFAVSYFTPGPQFGGEPFQVILLNKNHDFPIPAATATVTVEKLLLLITNGSFLMFGLLIAAGGSFLSSQATLGAIAFSIFLLLIPLFFFWRWWRGRRPLTAALESLYQRLQAGWLADRLAAALLPVSRTEEQIGELFAKRAAAVWVAVGASFASWILMTVEYWLMISFLGVRLGFVEMITLFTAVRVAFLMPTPGGVGTLEAAHVWALQLLGVSDAATIGLTISLLIRVRDVLIAGVGLWMSTGLKREG